MFSWSASVAPSFAVTPLGLPWRRVEAGQGDSVGSGALLHAQVPAALLHLSRELQFLSHYIWKEVPNTFASLKETHCSGAMALCQSLWGWYLQTRQPRGEAAKVPVARVLQYQFHVEALGHQEEPHCSGRWGRFLKAFWAPEPAQWASQREASRPAPVTRQIHF